MWIVHAIYVYNIYIIDNKQVFKVSSNCIIYIYNIYLNYT